MTTLRAEISELQPAADRRGTVRRKLRLTAQSTIAQAPNDVSIVDLSTTGLMLDTAVPLHVGETIEVELPLAGPTEAQVIWRRDSYFGCEFLSSLPQSVVSAALLRSPGQEPPEAVAAPIASPYRRPDDETRSPLLPASPALTMFSLGLLGFATVVLLLGLLLI